MPAGLDHFPNYRFHWGTAVSGVDQSRSLDWSAQASLKALGGPGRWILALPPDRVAGAQVINRARLSGQAGVLEPLVVCGADHHQHQTSYNTDPHQFRFSVDALHQALVGALWNLIPSAPVYLSLVPTQLYAVLNAPEPLRSHTLELLEQCRAILVGGAALDATLRAALNSYQLPIVTTYGMTETCGGCVYDGVPWPGVSLRIHQPDAAGTGLIELSGPMLAEGYVTKDGANHIVGQTEEFGFYLDNGQRWFRTRDLGQLDSAGQLKFLGRADDIIITGGVNVHPGQVEDALLRAWYDLTGQASPAVVVGVPSARWGQEVIAVIEHRAPLTEYQVAELKAQIKAKLGGPATPKSIIGVHQHPLPKLPGGKINRKAVATEVLGGGLS